MTTRLGQCYKEEIAEGTVSVLKSMEEMMEMMIEDRVKREDEFAEERKKHEKEREEEREIQDREVAKQMDMMYSQLASLAKLVEVTQKIGAEAIAAVGKASPKALQVKLVSLAEKDDIEAYLVTFEHIMHAYKIDKTYWTYHLAPQLSGRAQQAFAALSSSDVGNYDAVKATILLRYNIKIESYRRRFRNAMRQSGELNREFANRLMDLQGKWLKDCGSTQEVLEAVELEQFLNALPKDNAIWVSEKKPKTCHATGELADGYEHVRKREPEMQSEPNTPVGKWCDVCKRSGHSTEECWSKEKSGT